MQNKMYFSEVMVEVVIVCKAITMKWDVWFNAQNSFAGFEKR